MAALDGTGTQTAIASTERLKKSAASVGKIAQRQGKCLMN
jgi:hypothetical protein